MKEKHVILVDDSDKAIGKMEKMEAHRSGVLHRAFSIFIFNRKGEMLLQQRALNKYHSSGLWTNACCSHPQPGEKTLESAHNRLKEEMGFDTKLEKLFDFVYAADLENGLKEYEYDHVFAGEYDGIIKANPDEVNDFCYRGMNEITQSLLAHPKKYTVWFHIAFPKVEQWWAGRYSSAPAEV